MAKENNSGRSGGDGFLGLLAIVFIALKLTGHIDWSWWWVLAPIWGPLAIVAVVWLFCVIGIAVIELFEKRWG